MNLRMTCVEEEELAVVNHHTHKNDDKEASRTDPRCGAIHNIRCISRQRHTTTWWKGKDEQEHQTQRNNNLVHKQTATSYTGQFFSGGTEEVFSKARPRSWSMQRKSHSRGGGTEEKRTTIASQPAEYRATMLESSHKAGTEEGNTPLSRILRMPAIET
mmetsp:Transcript_4282/g.4563  ORF Transcript_4282/g.4563 Transcript_4282/m.4563 type:complete len:159 (-) Transcript_4282:99-575(-)